jgi:hypothetical protein
MKRNVAREIAALQRMTPKELRQRYAEAFGEPTRSGNRAYLVKRIAWRCSRRPRATCRPVPADVPPSWPATPTSASRPYGMRGGAWLTVEPINVVAFAWVLILYRRGRV